MKEQLDPPCLPKRFCFCIKLKIGVYIICAYLVFIGILQIISLTGAWDLGVNNILRLGDIVCGVFAGLSIAAMKKVKVGTPLKILGVLWGVFIIMNVVSHFEASTALHLDEFTKFEHQEHIKTIETNANALKSTTYLRNELPTNQTQTASTNQASTTTEEEDYEEYFKELTAELDQEQLNILYGVWNFFKIYCALCVFKLGLKIQTKHSRNFYYKLF